MDWTLDDNMVDRLFFCNILTGRTGGHTPFVQAGAETSDTGAVPGTKKKASLSPNLAVSPLALIGFASYLGARKPAHFLCTKYQKSIQFNIKRLLHKQRASFCVWFNIILTFYLADVFAIK